MTTLLVVHGGSRILQHHLLAQWRLRTLFFDLTSRNLRWIVAGPLTLTGDASWYGNSMQT